MILLIKLIVVLSIWCLGIKIVTARGMLFERVGVWGENKVDEGNNIWQAVLTCPWCLPSVHSVVAFAFAIGMGWINHFEWRLVMLWPFVLMGASLVTGLLWTLFETLFEVHKYFEDLNDYGEEPLYQ